MLALLVPPASAGDFTEGFSAMVAKEVSAKRARLFIDGAWCEGHGTFDVFDKFTGERIGEADSASREQVDAAVAAAQRSFETHKLEAWDRYRILAKTAELIEKRGDEIAETIIAEAGFPISDATNEVTRAAQVFLLSAEEG